MRALSLSEVIQLHEYVLEQSGGITGIRDFGALASAVAQSHMTFGGVDLYQAIQEKAATLCFSLVTNHPFVDGKLSREEFVQWVNHHSKPRWFEQIVSVPAIVVF